MIFLNKKKNKFIFLVFILINFYKNFKFELSLRLVCCDKNFDFNCFEIIRPT